MTMSLSLHRHILIGITVLFLAAPLQASAPWGFFAHRRINELAVYTLPEELFAFYKQNIDFVKEHAVDPDKRRYGVIGEAERHYIDIDHYCKENPDCDPFEIMPKRWYDAVEKYSEDTLRAYGIIPWHIPVMKERLTKAFKNKDIQRILRTSAELGHYIGDAHVPLHTTENYNGQLTNQKGIHGFWESRVPELYSLSWDFFVGKAKYVEDPLMAAWGIVEVSHGAVDSVLSFEAELNAKFNRDRKYSYEERGRVLTNVYSEEYTKAYDQMLNGQVERRMQDAIIMVGSIWYSAWVDAGQPQLLELSAEEQLLLEQEIQEDLDVQNKQELMNREHE